MTENLRKGTRRKGWGFVHGASDKPCYVHSITDPNGKMALLVRNQALHVFKGFVSKAIAKDNWGAKLSPILKACADFGVETMTWQTEALGINRVQANDLRKRLVAEALRQGVALYNRTPKHNLPGGPL